MNPYLDNHDRDAQIAFGNLIKAWFNQNGWSLEVAADWAKANNLTGPNNSQMSYLTRGMLAPKPYIFVQLHAFN